MTRLGCQILCAVNLFQLDVGIGRVTFTWNAQGLLTKIDLSSTTPTDSNLTLRFAGRQLSLDWFRLIENFQEYFEGGRPLAPVDWAGLDVGHLSEFQLKVYRSILEIPHGETRSYAWVAERIGRPFAQRAVGGALRSNPFPILVPCHRVVSSAGGLGGFMGKIDPDQPELQFKKKLLDLEYEYINPVFDFLSVPAVALA